jgi:hypothetical protein
MYYQQIETNLMPQNQITMFLIVFSRYVIRNDVFYVKGLKMIKNMLI